MDKKKEKEIFDKVYCLSDCYTVLESEKPDFIIEENDTKIRYGVEVTEHYFSNTSATLHNSKDFAKRIFEQKKIASQDHRKHIEFSTFSIVDENGEERTFEGIMTKEGDINLHNLRDIVNEKSNKFATYNSELHSIDLLILDRENFINSYDVKVFTHYLINGMRKTIIDAPFKSIFLITRQEEKEVYVDLKIQVAYFLIRCVFHILETEKNGYNLSSKNFVQNICWLLRSIELKNISYEKNALLFNGFMFEFTEEKTYIKRLNNIIKSEPEYTDIVFDDAISMKLKDSLPNLEFDRVTLISCDEKIVAI